MKFVLCLIPVCSSLHRSVRVLAQFGQCVRTAGGLGVELEQMGLRRPQKLEANGMSANVWRQSLRVLPSACFGVE